MKLIALATLFAAGVILSVGIASGGAADVTTTETATATETVEQTTTEPARTEVRTETIQQTTTRKVFVPATTTASSESTDNTPTWVWVLLAILAVAAIGLLIALLTRRGGGLSPEERRRRIDHTIATWAAQGWAVQSQTGDSAVLRRNSELMQLSVDEAGQVSTQPLT
jgi:hypothetical protein